MCARYTLTDPAEMLAALGVLTHPALPPRYNVAPSQLVAVVGNKPGGGGRGAVLMKWGFVPRWAKSATDGPRPVNAKAETIRTSPPFRDSFRDRRCLIPADGFFEWLTVGGKKLPHLFRPTVGGVMAFAGVWDIWKPPTGEPLFTCAVVTVPANAVVRPLHDRMPAILPPSGYGEWLDPHTEPDAAHRLLAPAPDDLLGVIRVSPVVNKPANDSPECARPLPDAEVRGSFRPD